MNMTFRLKEKMPILLTIGLISVCTVSITVLQQPILNQRKQSVTEEEYLRQEKAKATTLNVLEKSPSFGFQNLIADWLYLQFIQYFGDTEARETTGYELIPEYFRATVERDPRFVGAYLNFSVANTMFAGKPNLSVELLDQSLQNLAPNVNERGYELWLSKATDELLYLGDLQVAKQSYQRAAKWAEQSNAEGSDSLKKYAQRMIRFIETEPNTTKGRIGAWTLILFRSEQKVVQQEIIKKIEALGGKVVTSPEGRIIRVKVPPED